MNYRNILYFPTGQGILRKEETAILVISTICKLKENNIVSVY